MKKRRKIKKKGHVQQYTEKPGNIKKRLGAKYTSEDLHQLGHSFSGGDEDHSDQEELSVLCKIPNKFSIWNDQAMTMSKQGTSAEYEVGTYQSSKRYHDRSSEEDTLDGHDSQESEEPTFDPYRYDKHYRYRQNSADLRNSLNSSSQKSALEPKVDLRCKIQQLKNKDKPRKHRSPLCVDDSD